MRNADWKNTFPDQARRNDRSGSAGRAADERAALGISGEDLAARYLEASGYALLERRWRSANDHTGEIDLIVREGDEIVFVEVKTRRTGDYGHPEEAVTRFKQDQLRRTAWAYLKEKGLTRRAWRIDVVAIGLAPGAARPKLRHIRFAVGEAPEC